jgi:chromosome partitioning protein
MRTIAVVNQKGGCGKTITAINLSAFLAREQRRVLLVDMDPQGHATLGVLGNAVPPSKTMYDVFLQEAGGRATALRDVILTVHDNLHVAAADILLSAIPETLAGQIGRENILSEALAGVAGDYDYVVVDCPPAVGLLTFNALKACSEAIVPMDPSFFALHGIGKLLETFEVLVKDTGHQIAPRVLVTLYSGRSPFVKAVLDEIRHHLEGRHFDVVIRYSVKLAEAASHGVPIVDYCRQCAGFDDYQALAAEVLRQEADFPNAEPVAIHRNGSAARNGSDDHVMPAAPAPTPEGVMFTVEASDAEQVHLAGDFNDWTLEGSEMELIGGIWTKVVKLPPGRYRYRYVIDGQWHSDPLNAVVEPSAYGGLDSILVVAD